MVVGWEQLIDTSFLDTEVCPDTDGDLFKIQVVFMSPVLDLVLLNPKAMKLVRLYKDNPWTLWSVHETYQTSFYSSQEIAILLSDKLTNIKIAVSKSRTAFLEEFDTVL